MTSLIAEPGLGLHAALKAATAASHTRLETALALAGGAVTHGRILAVLKDFFGFYAVWEPRAAGQHLPPAFLAPRAKLGLVQADLQSLGMSVAEIRQLPLCAAARGLGGSAARALGTIYVLEGSTLGGQVINRALVGAAWAPAGGLRYFTPYGKNTGTMWRETLALLQETSSPAADADIIAGAVQTFDLLHDWFTRDHAG